jgi:K+-sensing histidine kinase KdpD
MEQRRLDQRHLDRDAPPGEPSTTQAYETREPRATSSERLREYGFATVAAVVATVLAAVLDRLLTVHSLALVFLTAVVAVAVRSRLSVALYAAATCLLSYDLFFTEPRFTLRIGRGADVVAVAAFVVAAIVCSHLGTRLRDQMVALRTANEQTRAAQVESETERLRTALLSSVSHDLRSPLASVIGAATSLSAYGDAMPDADRRELLSSIRSEGERLDRYIQNLLDMTRLGSGAVKLHRDWVAVEEVLSSAVGRVCKVFPALQVETRVAADLPLLFVHPALIEQALFNVLENAAKFSPAGAPVLVTARRTDHELLVEISDRGPGIPEQARRRIFERFESAEAGDSGRRGSGLGLTIVRGMVGAHGGRVEALPGPEGSGTTIGVTLPLPVPPLPDPGDDPV